MEQLELVAEARQITGKGVKTLRRQGWIPAVLYGPKRDPLALKIQERALLRLLDQAGMNRLIALQVAGADGPVTTLLREVQRDHISRRVLHADFQEVVMTQKIVTEVPIVLEGEAPVVRRGAGVLVHAMQAVEIQCFPGDLIQAIPVDLSILDEVDQTIRLGDLSIPETIEVLANPEELVVKVLPPRVVVEEVEELEEAEELKVIAEARAEQRRAERPPEEEEEEE